MTRKASAIYHDGNKIIRLSDLPMNQAHLFSGWIQKGSYVKLGDKNDFDCVQYEDYEYWYQYYYVTEKDLDNVI